MSYMGHSCIDIPNYNDSKTRSIRFQMEPFFMSYIVWQKMWITFLKKIWPVRKVGVTLLCQQMGRAPDKKGGGIKGSLRVTFFTKFFSNVDNSVKMWITLVKNIWQKITMIVILFYQNKNKVYDYFRISTYFLSFLHLFKTCKNYCKIIFHPIKEKIKIMTKIERKVKNYLLEIGFTKSHIKSSLTMIIDLIKESNGSVFHLIDNEEYEHIVTILKEEDNSWKWNKSINMWIIK